MKIYPLAYSESETSVITSISVSKLQKSRKEPYTSIKKGSIPPFVKIDGSVRYKWEDVMDFMDSLESVAKPHDNILVQQSMSKNKNQALNSPEAPFLKRCKFN